jgi:hypothetical protein
MGRILLHFDLRLVCHFLPDSDVLLDETGEDLRRTAHGLHRLLFQQRLGFRVFQRLHDLRIELIDDCGRRVGRRQDTAARVRFGAEWLLIS